MNFRKRVKIIFVVSVPLVILAVLVFLFSVSLAYEPNPTHAALVQKTAQLFNQYYKPVFSDNEIQEIVQGAIEEDTPPRWINHFYDPTTGQGWNSERMGVAPQPVLKAFSEIMLSPEDAVSRFRYIVST